MIQDLRSVLNQTANIQKMLLNQQGLKQLSKTQIEDISKTPPILGSLLLILDYQTQLFEYIQVKLVPNILVLQNQYLVLSNCTIQKYQVFHQTSEIKGIQLTSPKGVLYLFFKQRQQLAEWKAKLKTFCKLFNFLKKFKILDQFNREFYTIQKKKSKEIYSVQICQKTTDISKEAKYCEIQTLRSIKHQGLLDLKWVYEDQSNIFLVFEPFSGQKLDDLLLQGLSFQEVQLASIVLQILSLVKFLHKNGIYHGNINPSSIIVNSSNSYLQIYLINLVNIQIQPDKSICMIFQIIVEIDPADIYKQVIQKIYISPEILEDKSQPSVQSDLYAIGVFMYQLIFYGHYNANSESIDYDLIQKSEAFLESKQINFNVKSQNRMLYSISQIDLMKRLLKPADQRITLQDAMKHQWFINVKSKLRPKQIRKRKLPLPSLKTIIELCELQERNSSLLAYDDEQVSDEDMKIDSLMEQLHSVEEKIPSKESHIKYKQFTTYKQKLQSILDIYLIILMFIQKTQKIVFGIACLANSLAFYDYALDIRFVDGNFVITQKINADDLAAYKNKQMLMIEPVSQKHVLTTIQAVQGERVQSENNKFEVQIPQGGFYAKIYNSSWIFHNFHFNASIVGVPLLVI